MKEKSGMMIRALLAVACAVAAVAVLPVTASAQAPRQDSAIMIGGPGHANLVTVITLNATSGPSGENPSGQVEFFAFNLDRVSGPVTCLAVRGKTATINFLDQTGGFGLVTVEVADNEPDTFAANTVRSDPSDCSPLPFSDIGGPLSGADITIVDALPLPILKEQCKHGGWRNFGSMFKNQGQCVAFVERGPH